MLLLSSQQPQCRGARTAAAASRVAQMQQPVLMLRWRRPRQARAAAATAGVAAGAAPPELRDFFADMQQAEAMRQFDRDMDSLFWGRQGSPFAAARELERAVRRFDDELDDVATSTSTSTTTPRRRSDVDRVRVERSESRGPGSYRYYERIEINGGGGGGAWATPLPTAATAANGPPPLVLLAALVAAGAWAALTAAFARNFGLTLYAARDKLRLALAWPVLLLTSRSFRSQFVSAVVRGERVRVTRPATDVGGGGGGGLVEPGSREEG
jgi:hypothetical protein